MQQLEEFVDFRNLEKICRLRKALNSFKQASRCFNEELWMHCFTKSLEKVKVSKFREQLGLNLNMFGLRRSVTEFSY